MVRTQIHLAQDEVDALDRMSRITGASRSELIRRAVRELYHNSRSETASDDRLADIRAAAGIWRDRPFSTEEYLHAIRHGLPLPGE